MFLKKTYELIIMSEIPAHLLRTTSKEKLRCLYTLLNAFRASIYAVYYLKSNFITGDSLLHRSNIYA